MRIKVDGTEYPFPAIDSLTMDEAIVLERYAGVGIEDLLPGESLPIGAVKAFVIIAIMRSRPDVSEKEIAGMVGTIKLGDMGDLVQQEEDARPPEIPSESKPSDETSGSDSPSPSASSLAAVPPLSSGPPASDTSADSDQEMLGS